MQGTAAADAEQLGDLDFRVVLGVQFQVPFEFRNQFFNHGIYRFVQATQSFRLFGSCFQLFSLFLGELKVAHDRFGYLVATQAHAAKPCGIR